MYIPENEGIMSQSKAENKKPHILQNHTLKNNRAYEKYRIGGEGSNPIQICNQNINKNNKKNENY